MADMERSRKMNLPKQIGHFIRSEELTELPIIETFERLADQAGCREIDDLGIRIIKVAEMIVRYKSPVYLLFYKTEPGVATSGVSFSLQLHPWQGMDLEIRIMKTIGGDDSLWLATDIRDLIEGVFSEDEILKELVAKVQKFSDSDEMFGLLFEEKQQEQMGAYW